MMLFLNSHCKNCWVDFDWCEQWTFSLDFLLGIDSFLRCAGASAKAGLHAKIADLARNSWV